MRVGSESWYGPVEDLPDADPLDRVDHLRASDPVQRRPAGRTEEPAARRSSRRIVAPFFGAVQGYRIASAARLTFHVEVFRSAEDVARFSAESDGSGSLKRRREVPHSRHAEDSERLRFSAHASIEIGGQLCRQLFDGDVAIELRVACLDHSDFAQLVQDSIRTEGLAARRHHVPTVRASSGSQLRITSRRKTTRSIMKWIVFAFGRVARRSLTNSRCHRRMN